MYLIRKLLFVVISCVLLPKRVDYGFNLSFICNYSVLKLVYNELIM